MEIVKVGVVGCGTMGSGICEIVARSGVDVSFVEVTPARVEAGLESIKRSLQRAVDRGKLTEDERDDVVGRIAGDTSYEILSDADLVVEAVPERLAMKQETFRKLDEVMKPDAILATNTSSLPVTDIAVTTGRASHILGFHFFNPAPVMKLIELVTTVVTDPQVVATASEFAERIGKTPVIAKDRAGFVANLLLFPYLNQAVGMLEAGYATREDIDAAMQLGTGHPMGPLALMDLIGLDSAYAIMMRMYEQFGDTRHAPRPMIRQLLHAGFTGRKAGRGFYSYEEADQSSRTGAAADATAGADAIADWSTVGVLGTGTMATGIAEVSAKAGYAVVIRGRSTEKAEQAKAAVAKSLGKAVDRGKLEAAARDEALDRITTTTDIADFGSCDLVIEAVAEDLELKRDFFAQLDTITKPDAVLATTTSSMPVIDCAMVTDRPERVVGIHFFNRHHAPGRGGADGADR
jgi:3-hydroxybutyryl-CoA dehydrogenase